MNPEATVEETPDFSALLEGLDQELALSAQGDYWMTLVGIRVFDAPGGADSTLGQALAEAHARLPALIVETIRKEATAVRPRDVYMPLGDVFFVIFPSTPEENAIAPLRRILEAWRRALAEASLATAVQRTLHIGMVSWGPSIRSTSGRELLAFGAYMVDEAGRHPVDASASVELGIPEGSPERVHLARFRWL